LRLEPSEHRVARRFVFARHETSGDEIAGSQMRVIRVAVALRGMRRIAAAHQLVEADDFVHA
jgi:hypothetical protein